MAVDAIRTVNSTGQRVQRRVIYPALKVILGFRVVSFRRKVGCDIDSVCGDCDGLGKGHLLPTGCSFFCKRRASDQDSGHGPDMRNVGAPVVLRFVKAQCGNAARSVGFELHSEFARQGVAAIDRCGRHICWQERGLCVCRRR